MWESRSPPFLILIKSRNLNLISNDMRFFIGKKTWN
jgi:hypothetical protein